MSERASTRRRPSATRLLLGSAGLALLGYGVWRIFDNADATQPLHLGEWLLGAVILHDGVLSIMIIGVGWWLTQFVPGRGRAYLQGGLIAGGTVSAVAGFLIYRKGRSAPGQALLEQNYALHLGLILVGIAAVTGVCYALRVVRDRRVVTDANGRPDARHTSDT